MYKRDSLLENARRNLVAGAHSSKKFAFLVLRFKHYQQLRFKVLTVVGLGLSI